VRHPSLTWRTWFKVCRYINKLKTTFFIKAFITSCGSIAVLAQAPSCKRAKHLLASHYKIQESSYTVFYLKFLFRYGTVSSLRHCLNFHLKNYFIHYYVFQHRVLLIHAKVPIPYMTDEIRIRIKVMLIRNTAWCLNKKGALFISGRGDLFLRAQRTWHKTQICCSQ
jgi:hypothetical protein